MKKKVTTFLLVIVLIAGLSLLLYPTVSDFWNSYHSSQAVAKYDKEVKGLDKDRYREILSDAQKYNEALSKSFQSTSLSDEQEKKYNELLNIDGTGIMGYIEIPNINVYLPIYHGTNENVLQIAVGHLEWSSLPVGGEGSHCVLSGHRGLPSAKLFTNLDQLEKGDTFVVRVLNEVYTYEVDQIRIVLPEEVSDLMIEDGKDLCTLVTCTPYGINSHRLLVRGHRVANAQGADDARVISDAMHIDTLIVASVLAVPIIIVLFIVIHIEDKRKIDGGEDYAE